MKNTEVREKKNIKLYYEAEEGEFYWVKETPKTFSIDWVEKNNCDSKKTPLDQNVRWKNLKVSKEKNRQHCLRDYDEKSILIYPFQAGQPFYLELATETHIHDEIQDCIKWGVSTKYYDDLRFFINPS